MPETIQKALVILRAGGLIGLPTETVYGLGADASNPLAVAKIFTAKGRPAGHPLIVHIADAQAIAVWAREVPETAWTLARRFWPGPLTLVLKRGAKTPLEVTGGLDTVALRVPRHPLALQLLKEFGGGIAAPSANKFGSVSPTTAEHVRQDLGATVDLVLDGGPCEVGLESTIVDLSQATPQILRHGAVTLEQIEAALDQVVLGPSQNQTQAPGSHALHYAPKARLELLEPSQIQARAQDLKSQGQKVALLAAAADLEVMARELYQQMRNLDEQNFDVILASPPQGSGLAAAIRDRLSRAAGPRHPQQEQA